MRTCIDLGLHRKTPVRNMTLLEVEQRKRIFWVAYTLDRQVSIILGRPFAISDHDIDVELPLDVNEGVCDLKEIENAAKKQTPPGQSSRRSTSLSSFIHIIRLRRIESSIQQSIYRVDRTTGATIAQFEGFLARLDDWKKQIPLDAHNYNVQESVDGSNWIDGLDYYIVYYHKTIRFLLHPHLSSENPSTNLLLRCAMACGGVCQTYKRLHQSVSVGFSLMALHSVFLAGLSLIYCTWVSPSHVFSINVSNDMNACSIVLYIITERWPGAKQYRDVFETIKQSVLDSIAEGACVPRKKIEKLPANVREAMREMDQEEEGRQEFSSMLADMTGEREFVASSEPDNDKYSSEVAGVELAWQGQQHQKQQKHPPPQQQEHKRPPSYSQEYINVRQPRSAYPRQQGQANPAPKSQNQASQPDFAKMNTSFPIVPQYQSPVYSQSQPQPAPPPQTPTAPVSMNNFNQGQANNNITGNIPMGLFYGGLNSQVEPDFQPMMPVDRWLVRDGMEVMNDFDINTLYPAEGSLPR